MREEKRDVSQQVTRVVAAIITRGDQFLVCRRPPDKRYGELWEFPGGKCGVGESLSAAAQRELREELGVDVIEVGDQEAALYDPGSPHLIIFAPVRILGEPTCREHIELRWARLSEINLLPLPPADRWYVDFLLAGGTRKVDNLRADS